ncbi:MAG: GNAT family N-acetyltransferase [Alphaproteobacteria bacterium]|nr:GNAT family N-acetyltransferase [Alphaproteobacteria bacterium]MCL2504958.1 GNAT family N-acetyltransferase [Alphaproteobacteria bacterium]
MSATIYKLDKNSFEDSVRLNNLEVRLAVSTDEVQAAQELRYKVFYEEMGAKPNAETLKLKRDFDIHDEHCDHLLLFDHANKKKTTVVGTYRLIRRVAAEKTGGFYSSSEYDITKLLDYPGEILELGRSCIDAEYRTGPVMQLLWRGLGIYVAKNNISLMFGCASLPGTDIEALKVPLSYLYYHHLAPPALLTKALPEQYIDMRLLPKEAFNPDTAFNELKLDPRGGNNSLPPLIKGYIRVGGFVGDGAVIDHQFNTTDICIIVKTDLMTRRYKKHYDLGSDTGLILPE